MTTIPGQNQIMQQSGIVQEISQQANAPKPSPDQAAVLQQAQEKLKNSTVLESETAEQLRKKKEQSRRRQKERRHKVKHQAKADQNVDKLTNNPELTNDPDMYSGTPGWILDTTA